MGPITITAVYCPLPKYSITPGQFKDFFNTLGHRFLAGGDCNVKHPYWGSRLRILNPKGRQLYETMQRNNLQHLSTGQPTYWPTDRRKTSNCIDFCVTIASNHLTIESCFELSSEHSPVLAILSSAIKLNNELPYPNNRNTNWEYYRDIINEKLNCKISLKTEIELEEAIENFIKIIQKAAWESTPKIKPKFNTQHNYSLNVITKIKEKRKIRKKWQISRSAKDKSKLNKATKKLKTLLQDKKNLAIQKYLDNLLKLLIIHCGKQQKKINNQSHRLNYLMAIGQEAIPIKPQPSLNIWQKFLNHLIQKLMHKKKRTFINSLRGS